MFMRMTRRHKVCRGGGVHITQEAIKMLGGGGGITEDAIRCVCVCVSVGGGGDD